MQTKQTPTEQEGDTPELRLDKIREDVRHAYDDASPATDTLQSSGITSGEEHPGRVATESQLPSSPNHPSSGPAADGVHKNPEQV